MLATLRGLPPRGSIQESVLIVLQLKQEEVNHARMRALSQIMIDKDKGVETFEEYMRAAFPWVESSRKKERADQIRKLQEEVNRGPMSVQPLWQKPIRSRLKTRTEDNTPLTKKQMSEVDATYRKMGKVIPK